jgi:serine/threonine-protein kinase HipA
MIEKLIAYKDTDVVGVLDRVDSENYVFNYEVSWLESKFPQPLSLTLPLQEGTFPPGGTKAFFANLLPEGQLRDHLASKSRISPDDDFALLVQLAGDCAGAIWGYCSTKLISWTQRSLVQRRIRGCLWLASKTNFP